MTRRAVLLVGLLLGAGLVAPPAATASTSCVACHTDAAIFGEDRVAALRASLEESVHAAVGLSCHDCHGGDPDASLADRMMEAMDPEHAANPYVGAPSREEQPGFCGRCHADAGFMKRFVARPRTDQVSLYWTSGHGRALRAGDPAVAVCTDCHGSHDIRPPTRTSSRVHPTRIAETCAACHADASRMDAYGLPVDVFAEWRASVHATALLDKNDLSAPTCNDCHGNHGATPPGVDSVAATCGACHSREAELFRQSPKAAALEMHAAFTESLEGAACADCHPAPHPAAALDDVSLHGCVACHDNHAVLSSRVTMLSPLADTPCAYCHPDEVEPVGLALVPEPGERFAEVRDALVEEASARGLEGEARFDWLLEQARRLPHHLRDASGQGGLEPQVALLMRRLRVAGTHESHADPRGNGRVSEAVRRCGSCHPSDGTGYEVSRSFQRAVQEVSATAAHAERVLLAAERGGVAVGEAQRRLDGAIDATVDLVALVHGFSAEEGGAFASRSEEALREAQGAIDAAREALGELSTRRRGLLGMVGLVLVAVALVALKIRQLSREQVDAERP